MTETWRHQTNNPYEAQFGYSRAVRRGQFIFVSGTTSLSPTTGDILHPGEAYEQALVIFAEIIKAVGALGGSQDDIIRVRMFVTHEEDTTGVARALKETLGRVAPAATMIVGARFVDAKMLVEIEGDAVIV